MGQYYVIANITKKEYINPSHLGSGIKLMEFAMDGQSAMTGLAILLASSNGQGGGDLHLPAGSEFAHIPGRWAGDRIVVAGDYDDMPSSPGYKVYDLCRHVSALQELAEAAGEEGDRVAFRDISYEVMGCLLEDGGFQHSFVTVEGDSTATWTQYIKAQRRDTWKAARPNDPIPSELS
jgi:hypothetical protein